MYISVVVWGNMLVWYSEWSMCSAGNVWVVLGAMVSIINSECT